MLVLVEPSSGIICYWLCVCRESGLEETLRVRQRAGEIEIAR